MYSWIDGLDPPHGVGGEAEALLGLEALHRLHQADIAFRDDFGDRQAIAAIAHGDLGDEAQMAGDELVRGVAVAMLAPALGEHVFLLRLQHREPPDFLEIAGQTAFGGEDRQSRGTGHDSALHCCAPGSGGRCVPPLPEPTARHVCDRDHADRSCSIYRSGWGERKYVPSHHRDRAGRPSPHSASPLVSMSGFCDRLRTASTGRRTGCRIVNGHEVRRQFRAELQYLARWSDARKPSR